MQGVGTDARRDLEAKNFRVIDFTQPELFMEMRRAFTPAQPPRMR